MKSKNVLTVVALILGGILTTVAFIGTFWWAGVSDFGTVSSPTLVDSVRYRGDTQEVLDPKQSDPTGFIGYTTQIQYKTASGDTTAVAGVIKAADNSTIQVTTAANTVVSVPRAGLTAISVHSFTYGKADWGQKIFYFHVPVAVASFLIFLFAAYFAIRFLMTRERKFDVRSKIAMEVSFLFIILTMIMGILWTKAAWFIWWEWEPRLTTYFILTLLTIAYFVLRSSIEDEERRAVYASVFCLLAAIDVPISFAITRLIPSTHPVISKGGLEGPMLASFLLGMFGMMMIAYVFYQLRLREEILRDRVEAVKTALEG